MVKQEANFLAIFKDTQQYALLEEETTQWCIQSLYGAYPLSLLLMSTAESPSCAYGLFIRDDMTVTQISQRTS